MKLELHCHSTCSDGSHSPGEVARRARDRGVELFCLTDHDTIAGYDDTAAELGDATVLRGLELSCWWQDRGIHLLLYGLVPGPGLDALQKRLDTIQRGRRSRIQQIADKLDTLGAPIDAEAILASGAGRSLGRPDIARALLSAGHVRSLREAFDRYLKDNGPAFVPSSNLTLAEGLELGRNAGARMSMAHPHTLGGVQRVRSCFEQHQSAGLQGIEAYYGRYSPNQRRPWVRLAEDFGLIATGGSDFHGETLPEVIRPVIDLPPAIAEPLASWLLAS